MQSETELKTVVIFSYARPKDCCLHSIPRGDPYNGLYGGWGGAAIERPGTIFRLRRIKKGRDFITWSIWRGRRIFSFVWNKGQEGLTDAFHGFEKVEKTFCFCDLFTFFLRQSIWKVKGCKVLNFLGVWKGYHLSMEGIRKGYLFCQIWLDQVSPHPPSHPRAKRRLHQINLFSFFVHWTFALAALGSEILWS